MGIHGGYIAISPCGCLRGWVAELSDEESRQDVINWLRDGCMVKQIPAGEEIRRPKCKQHTKRP